MANSEKLEDFGQKIGGARKDLWESRGLRAQDTVDMSDTEKKTYIKRDFIWPKETFESGTEEERYVSFWREQFRKSILSEPKHGFVSDQDYINRVRFLRTEACAVKTLKGVDDFYERMNHGFILNQTSPHSYDQMEKFYGVINVKVYRKYCFSDDRSYYVKRDADKISYGLTKEQVARREYPIRTADDSFEIQSEKLAYHTSSGTHYFYPRSPKGVEALKALKPGMSLITHEGDICFSGTAEECKARQDELIDPETQLREPYSVETFQEPWHAKRSSLAYAITPEHDLYFFTAPTIQSKVEAIRPGDHFVLNGRGVELVGTEEECQQYIEKQLAPQLEKLQKAEKGKGKSSKQTWTPPQLASIDRQGEDYRHGKDADGDMFLEAFGVRGVEFGNWTNTADRQVSLNMAYDSLKDLARALSIPEKEVSLPGLSLGSMALAFGARGRGSAAAHYEPGREVINITKMHGAGSLAHEWGHCFDHFINQKCENQNTFASEEAAVYRRKIPNSVKELMNAIVCKKGNWGAYTKYYTDSREYGGTYAKYGNGYWDSKVELFARAFSCYVQDKLESMNIQNDYLTGHSECNAIPEKNIYAYPRGEERQRINQCFDAVIAELKELGYLHNQEYEPYVEQKAQSITEQLGTETPAYQEADSGQIGFLGMEDTKGHESAASVLDELKQKKQSVAASRGPVNRAKIPESAR